MRAMRTPRVNHAVSRCLTLWLTAPATPTLVSVQAVRDNHASIGREV